MQQLKRTNLPKAIALAIVGIQLFDIVIHIVTDQIELMRIASNVIIMTWVSALLLGRSSAHSRLVSYGALIMYAILNTLFVAMYGVTNPAQDGALRIVLFVLVFFTIALSVWMIHVSSKR